MTFLYAKEHLEQHNEGEIDLELIAIKYDGTAPILSISNLRSEGYWPGRTALTKNRWYVAPVPDVGLTQYEANVGLEVRYGPESVAEALLTHDYLPPAVFGTNSHPPLQEFVFDELGLDNIGLGEEREEQYREQLKEIAGVEDEDGIDDLFSTPEDKTEEQELADDSSRSELQSQASELGMDGEKVQNAGKLELAEYILEDREDVTQ